MPSSSLRTLNAITARAVSAMPCWVTHTSETSASLSASDRNRTLRKNGSTHVPCPVTTRNGLPPPRALPPEISMASSGAGTRYPSISRPLSWVKNDRPRRDRPTGRAKPRRQGSRRAWRRSRAQSGPGSAVRSTKRSRSPRRRAPRPAPPPAHQRHASPRSTPRPVPPTRHRRPRPSLRCGASPPLAVSQPLLLPHGPPRTPLVEGMTLQFWPAPPAPDPVVRRTSQTAAYRHGMARSLPPPPIPGKQDRSLPDPAHPPRLPSSVVNGSTSAGGEFRRWKHSLRRVR